jgi:hypothetical protein
MIHITDDDLSELSADDYCHNCGMPSPESIGVDPDDEFADEYDFCTCELCYVCGEDTHNGMAMCACERRAAGSGP